MGRYFHGLGLWYVLKGSLEFRMLNLPVHRHPLDGDSAKYLPLFGVVLNYRVCVCGGRGGWYECDGKTLDDYENMKIICSVLDFLCGGYKCIPTI